MIEDTQVPIQPSMPLLPASASDALWDEALDLMLRTLQFSLLINSGLSLMRSFQVLIDEAGPLKAVWQEISHQVEQGHTLSRALRARPDVFPPFYVAMTRAGEVGGVLDETLKRTAELLQEDWELSRAIVTVAPDTWPMLMGNRLPERAWAELGPYQQKLLRLLFCRALGYLLGSGVPLTLSLEIVAQLLPRTQGQAVRARLATMQQGATLSLEGLEFLPPFVTYLAALGEERGALDIMLDRAAQFYRYELEVQLGMVNSNLPLALRQVGLADSPGRNRIAEMNAALTVLLGELFQVGSEVPNFETPLSERVLWPQISTLAHYILVLAIKSKAAEIRLERIAPNGRHSAESEIQEIVSFRIGSTRREILRASAFLGSQLDFFWRSMAGFQGLKQEGHIHLRYQEQDYDFQVTVNPFIIAVQQRGAGT